MSFRAVALSAMFVLAAAAVASAQATAPSTKAEELSAAARKGDAATVKKLLDEGVDPNTKYRYGVTPLFYACDHGHLDVVKVLLDHGAEVNVKDTFYGMTPLILALGPAQKKTPAHTEIAKLLIAKGAQGKDQALSTAVSEGDAAMAKIVVDSGGLSAESLTDALELARANGKTDVARVLEQAGAKPYDDFKIDAAQLTSYSGTYNSATGPTLVFAVAGSRLTGGPSGQTFVLSPMDAVKFRVIGRPNTTVTFQSADGKVTGLTLTQGGNTVNYTRAEGK